MIENIFRAVVLVLAAIVAGCATQGAGPLPLVQCQEKQAICAKERQMCLGTVDRLSKSIDKHDSEQSELANDLANTKKSLADCQANATQVNREVTSLSIAKSELEQRLKQSIQQKDVQIELLNDKLSVRVLDRILFDSGSIKIRLEGIAVLGQVARVLVGRTEHVRVEGHTDDVPISALLAQRYPTNWELSGARAASVVRLFQDEHQIDPARMEAVGHAFYVPVAPNDTAENRQRNRRVEVVLTAIK